METVGEVFCDAHNNGGLSIERGPEDNDSGAELLAQAVHQLAKGFAVHLFHLGDDHLDPLDGFGLLNQFIHFGQSALALLLAELLFELPGGMRELFDGRKQGVLADVESGGDLAKDAERALVVGESLRAGDGFPACR